MISFEDYFDLLEERQQILNFFNNEAKSIAENAKYLRNKKIIKKYQKDNEKARGSGLSVYYAIYNKKLKEKGVKVSVIKSSEDNENPIKKVFKKLFHIKPKEIPGEIEELPEKICEIAKEDSEIDTTGIQIDATEIENIVDPEYTEEELNELYPNDIIEGQMDVEDLNEGDVYES